MSIAPVALPVDARLADETQEHEILRLNLSDIPHLPANLDVEGLKPTWWSRLLDLVAPLPRR